KEEGDTVYVGETIATLDPSGEPVESASSEAAETPAPAAQEAPASAPADERKTNVIEEEYKPGQRSINDPIASPAARKQAREKGIDLSAVHTCYPLGRIRVEDVKAQAEQQVQVQRQQPAAQPAAPIIDDGRPVERVRMSRRRQTIAKRLVEVQHTAAMLTTFNEVDMSAVIEL